MLWEATIRQGEKFGKVDWRGAMRISEKGLLELPAKDEEHARQRVRLLTARALSWAMEPMMIESKTGRWKFRRELPSAFRYLVTVWLVTKHRDRDEARASVWEALDGGRLIRVSSVKDGFHGYCEAEVGVIARCEEQAEVMVREILQDACSAHDLAFVPIDPEQNELWVEQRAQFEEFSVDNGAGLG
jgi:hypothetical protein